jgi:enoyl-CoA hydratase/carnithine racemase
VTDEVLYDVAGALGRVTINRPERRNALTWAAVRRLRAVVAEAEANAGVRVLTLTGAGDEAFCSGADLAEMAPTAGPSLLDLHDARGELGRLFLDLWRMGKPTIARVQGYALAAGFGLALACDFVVASVDAEFGTPEIDRGLWPHMVTVPLVRSMPPKKALELMLTGRRVGAEEAERIGFVNVVAPAAKLDEAVDELAAALAAKSPTAVRLGRTSFYAAWDRSAEDALAYLHSMLTLTTLTEDAREGIAAFGERRRPDWKGR